MKLRGKEAKRVAELELHETFLFCGVIRIVTKKENGLLYYAILNTDRGWVTSKPETLMANSLMYVEMAVVAKKPKIIKEPKVKKKHGLNGKEYGILNKPIRIPII